MGLTTLLAMAILLDLVGTSLPRADTLPLLGSISFYISLFQFRQSLHLYFTGIFFVMEMFIVCVCLLIALTLLSIHHNCIIYGYRPPTWLMTICCDQSIENKSKMKSAKISTSSEELSRLNLKYNNYSNIGFYCLMHASSLHIVDKYIDRRQHYDDCFIAWLKIFTKLNLFLLIIFETLHLILAVAILVARY
jgi:hypothetical protein